MMQNVQDGEVDVKREVSLMSEQEAEYDGEKRTVARVVIRRDCLSYRGDWECPPGCQPAVIEFIRRCTWAEKVELKGLKGNLADATETIGEFETKGQVLP